MFCTFVVTLYCLKWLSFNFTFRNLDYYQFFQQIRRRIMWKKVNWSTHFSFFRSLYSYKLFHFVELSKYWLNKCGHICQSSIWTYWPRTMIRYLAFLFKFFSFFTSLLWFLWRYKFKVKCLIVNVLYALCFISVIQLTVKYIGSSDL